MLLHFPPPALPGTEHQQWLARAMSSHLPADFQHEAQATLLALLPSGGVVPTLDLFDLEIALASGSLKTASVEQLAAFLATKIALARQFLAGWEQPPTWRQRMRHNGGLGAHIARFRRLWPAWLKQPDAQPLARFRQAFEREAA